MVLSFLFWLFMAYLAYKLIFGLVIPLFRTTRRIRKSFREMQEQMQGAGNGFNRQETPRPQATAAQPHNKGAEPEDYIEFEEVK